jgi:glycosyltransferase involved in cell wall biosynthesis
MKILWLATHPRENPSTRFRILQYGPLLAQHGITITFRSLLTSRYYLQARRPGTWLWKGACLLWFTVFRLKDVLAAWRYDAVVVLREVYPFGPSFLERWLLALNRKVIFDFDDAVFMRFEKVNNPLDRFRDFDKTRLLIRGSCWTVAGSRALVNYAGQYTNRVQWIPTVVDTHYYHTKQHHANANVVLGWMGTHNNLLHLRLIEKVLAALQRKHGVRIHVVCNQPFFSEGLQVRNLFWSEARERELLQGFDIGLMPLYDDPYSQGKCAFKLIQYLANGVPAVCSPVGENRLVMTDGQTGFLAGSDEEWLEKIERLIVDPALRAAMGQRGRKHIEEHFSLDVGR